MSKSYKSKRIDRVLNEGFDAQGRSAIAMWSNPITIYERANGTFFIMDGNKRVTVVQRSDGSFYLATHPRMP